VRTTIDPGMQEAADAAVETTLRQYGERYRASQAALVLIENGGAVRAMVGGATTAKASSTAPRARSGSPAPRSRSTPIRWPWKKA
jgi:membrane peptidoglycan carboxypeptidase